MTEPAPDAAPAPAPAPVPRRYGTIALALAIPALAASLLVGWMLPLGAVALGYGIAAVRMPQQRTAGAWAIGLSGASLLYSAGWLGYAAAQAGWFT